MTSKQTERENLFSRQASVPSFSENHLNQVTNDENENGGAEVSDFEIIAAMKDWDKSHKARVNMEAYARGEIVKPENPVYDTFWDALVAELVADDLRREFLGLENDENKKENDENKKENENKSSEVGKRQSKNSKTKQSILEILSNNTSEKTLYKSENVESQQNNQPGVQDYSYSTPKKFKRHSVLELIADDIDTSNVNVKLQNWSSKESDKTIGTVDIPIHSRVELDSANYFKNNYNNNENKDTTPDYEIDELAILLQGSPSPPQRNKRMKILDILSD